MVSALKTIKSLAACVAVGVSLVSFAEDAYLESDGTQVILTDYYPTEKMRLVVDFRITQESTSQSICGNKDNAGSGASFQVWQNGTPNLEGNFTSASNGDIWSARLKTGIGTNRYIVEVDYAAGTFVLLNPDGSLADPSQGVKKPGGERRTGVGNRPLGFFRSSPSFIGAAQTGAKMKLYSAKVYEEGVLIHDYVPCKKGDRVGLYDMKEEHFFGRYAGNPLAFGGDILTVEDDHFVEFDGTDYIQTNYLPQPDTRIELDFLLTDTTAQQFLVEAGSANDKDLMTRIYVNGSRGFSWSFADRDNYTTFPDKGTDQVFAAVGRRQLAIVDGYARKTIIQTDGMTQSERDMWTTPTVATTSAKLRLFYNRYDKRFTKGRIYAFRISEGGVLKRDYVAVKENGVAFLRDTLTGQTLYPTAQEPYVESTGNQIVVLDYKPNAKTVVEVECSHIQRAASRYIFGADDGVNSLFAWLNNNLTDAGIEFNTHNCWSWRQVTGVENLAVRKSLIVDVPNSLVMTRTDEKRLSNADISTRDNYVADVGESAYPMALFNVNGKSPALGNGVAGRIYRVTVKEEDKVVRLYEPYAKDGVVGFRDTLTGNFFSGLLKGEKKQVNLLHAGGTIAHEGAIPDAYIESDQTQYILTDYLPKTTTKVVFDFQLTKLCKDFYLFGCNATPNWELYMNSAWGFSTICHTGWATQTTAENWANLERTQMVIDRVRGKWSIVRGTATHPDFKTYGAASATEATVPFGIFGRQEPNGTHYPLSDTAVTGGMTPMRVYSFRVYEGDVLVHEYLPYKNGTKTGLKDTVTGAILTSDEGNPFAVGGMGYDGTKTFVTELANATVEFNGTATFSVFAPGAIRYEWTRGGESLAETGDSVTLGWQRVPGDHTQEIAVTPIYNVYGAEVKGTPSTATLTNEPRGLTILLR